MTKMNNRVYGVIGIGSKMANWNADYDGNPKTNSDGVIFGSDKALKYSMRNFWKILDEKVLYTKTYKDKNKLGVRELKEQYENLFGETIKNKDKSEKVLNNIFSAIDTINFGGTFPVSGHNYSITGAVQIGQGLNKYEDAQISNQDILSPFRNSNNADAKKTTMGKIYYTDEAHYFYPFTVNPHNYQDYEDVLDEFEGYTKEAYEKFKDASLVGANSLNTNSKFNCFNEFGLFIELKENSFIYLPSLDEYIDFNKDEDINVIDITKLEQLTADLQDEISLIEIYYNPIKTRIEHKNKIDAKFKNIITKKDIK